MAKDMKNTRMETYTKAISKMAKLMAQVFLSGSQAKCMMDSGRRDLRMDMGYGGALKESTILESGRTAGLMVKACMSGATEISMKVNGRMV